MIDEKAQAYMAVYVIVLALFWCILFCCCNVIPAMLSYILRSTGVM